MKINKQLILEVFNSIIEDNKKYVYFATTKNIKDKYIHPVNGKLHVSASYFLGCIFLSTKWSGRSMTADWDDRNHYLKNITLTERELNWVNNELKNKGGYLYKLQKKGMKMENYSNPGGDSGTDFYFSTPQPIIEKIKINDAFKEIQGQVVIKYKKK
jgi:hypothetical protein